LLSCQYLATVVRVTILYLIIFWLWWAFSNF
jgi:hypothetical protein